ncbi:MAG: hypothetical protein GXO78_10065 [Calditrichaeota bacterium]|nr:hypothetical protein [Calditrichota bacterium]
MLDQIIENIIQKIRREVVQPGMDRIPLTYIMTRNIPDSVKHFFDQEVEIWLREEADKFSTSDRFDYDLPEVRVLIDKIFDILKQTATFHITVFNRLLERAIKLEANYLIRPHQTLTQFLFKDSFTITTMEVYDMLKYFEKFQYYKDALTDYFNLKYMREISQPQFEELIEAIDKQVFSKNTVETTLQMVKTIVNFLNEGRTPPSDTISLEILLTAFNDRNLSPFVHLVEQEQRAGTQEISLADLEQMLRSGKPLSEVKAAAEAERKLEEIADIEEEKPEVQVESITVSEVTEPPPVVEEKEEEELLEEEEEEVEEVGKAAEQLADVVAEKIKGDHLEDLHKLIKPKQRKKFIKKIFRKNESQYLEFIDLLNRIPDWKKASRTIDEYFMTASINPYSKEALEFSDLVYNRYFPKDRPLTEDEF